MCQLAEDLIEHPATEEILSEEDVYAKALAVASGTENVRNEEKEEKEEVDELKCPSKYSVLEALDILRAYQLFNNVANVDSLIASVEEKLSLNLKQTTIDDYFNVK